ncbi:MAG: hypothetical protein FWF67_06765 [Fibromonadales bacterium]|nr:hypothetical protein [Fibromonadales bacterium]
MRNNFVIVRASIIRPLLIVTLGLALAFITSCSDPGGGGKGNDIKKYATRQIGNQWWMTENLNYNVNGSVCYENNDSYCDKYGRLYDWATAMDLDPSCNSTTCADKIDTTKHRGICPAGWHIPSNADWDELLLYIDSVNVGRGESDGIRYNSYTAGKYLKANNDSWVLNNGTDEYKFSALPGGYGNSSGSFREVGQGGFWWSATWKSIIGWNGSDWVPSESNSAYNLEIDGEGESAIYNVSGKGSALFSVRCVKD